MYFITLSCAKFSYVQSILPCLAKVELSYCLDTSESDITARWEFPAPQPTYSDPS